MGQFNTLLVLVERIDARLGHTGCQQRTLQREGRLAREKQRFDVMD